MAGIWVVERMYKDIIIQIAFFADVEEARAYTKKHNEEHENIEEKAWFDFYLFGDTFVHEEEERNVVISLE